jgi:hypothetical protein
MQLKNIFSALILLLFLGGNSAKAQSIGFSTSKDTAQDFRFNLLVGVSEGVNKMEVGMFLNVDRKNVKYFQAAGFVNVVGGNVQGCQVAGFANVNGGSGNGLQASGFMNVNKDSMNGIQASGFANLNGGNMKGVQAAGWGNHAKNLDGMQAAGFINVADSNASGLQVAGFANYTTNLTGIQAAGFLNVAKTIKRGIQIAPFNFADSGGIPIGIFSYVRQGGYHKVEIFSDEMFYTNIAFRSGVREFHNIFTAGLRLENSPNMFWTYGYGAGTTFGLTKKIDMDIDLTANQINNTGYFYRYWSNDFKLYTGVDWYLGKNLSLAGGPELNVYALRTRNSDFLNAFDDIRHGSYIYDQQFSRSTHIKAWIGWKFAIRFL